MNKNTNKTLFKQTLFILILVLIAILITIVYTRTLEKTDELNINETFSFNEEFNSDETYEIYDKKIVVLDAGHDQYTNQYEDYIEGVTMLSLAYQIKPLLEEAGITVFLTREDGDFVELSDRAAFTNLLSLEMLEEIKMNEGNLDDETLEEIEYLKSIMNSIIDNPNEFASNYLNTPFDEENTITDTMQRLFEIQNNETLRNSFLFISLHSDGLEEKYYDYVAGADVYYISNNMPNDFGAYYTEYSSIENNLLFSDILLDDIDEAGMPRSDILEGNFHVLREVNVPAVLVENGYHTNDEDRAKLQDEEFITSLAHAYKDSIIEYFNTINENH